MEEMAAKLPEVSLGGSVLKLPRAKNGSEFGVCFRVFDLSNFQNLSTGTAATASLLQNKGKT